MECAYARRHRCALTLVTFQLNDIPKNAEDELVDSVMGTLSVTITETTRGEDVLARAARDAFILLLRGDEEEGVRMAERVREEAVRAMSGRGGAPSANALACAVAQLGCAALATPSSAIDWAVQALGRVRVVARDRVVRLPPLKSPAYVPKRPR